jgi:molybdopterin molybdotransferase
LAEDIFAPDDLPAFPNSTVDGFALRAFSTLRANPQKAVLLRVVGDIAAGHTSELTLEEGQAIRIMTGAPIPAGADGVVPLEDTDAFNREAGTSAPQQVLVDCQTCFDG